MQWIGNCSHLELDVHLQLIPRRTPYALYFKCLFKKQKTNCIKQETAFQFCWYCSLSSTCCSTADKLHSISTTCTTRTKPRCWRSWSNKHILATLPPAKVHTSLGPVCMQKLSLTQGSSLLWLCLENFTPHPKKAGGYQMGKEPNRPKNLSINVSPATVLASLYLNAFLHKCSCRTISPSAEQAAIYQRIIIKHQADLILHSSLLHCYFPRNQHCDSQSHSVK